MLNATKVGNKLMTRLALNADPSVMQDTMIMMIIVLASVQKVYGAVELYVGL